jgi:hypothetical protein
MLLPDMSREEVLREHFRHDRFFVQKLCILVDHSRDQKASIA